jgi:hypothetical protein
MAFRSGEHKWILLSSFIALSFGAGASPAADWVTTRSSSPEIVKPAPEQVLLQVQNPPSFAWPRHANYPAQYVVEILPAGGIASSHTVSRNFLLPSSALPLGNYEWRVRPLSTPLDWSDKRPFTIDSNSRNFIVPASSELATTVRAHPRPRQLPASFAQASAWNATMDSKRRPSLTRLVSEVNLNTTAVASVSDGLWTTPNDSGQYGRIANAAGAVIRQMEAAALLFRLTQERRYLDEAILRGDQLAALNPDGPTSYKAQDQVARMIALVLAKGVDFLWLDLDAPRRAQWLSVAAHRLTPIYADLSGAGGRLDQSPMDSHGVEALGYLAAASTLLLDARPEAQAWFDFAVRSYMHIVHVWSGPEGGFANGSAYGQYTTDMQLQLWQPLAEATGVNLFNKPWAAGFSNYFMQFIPPNSPRHVFGDVHESKPDPALLMAYVARQATPAAAWYTAQLGTQENPITLLQAPYPLPADTIAAEAPANAMLFPSIGWAAMHSDISNSDRTSIYFKSSPFGAFNHSHGDQNSLVINSGGKPLLIEAGYQDYYASPLSQNWYRQSRAHNAITFDGGKGQFIEGHYEMRYKNGKITTFTHGTDLDYVEGDASAAYSNDLSLARRQVWYSRLNDVVVVRDTLSSITSRTFEWNIHALNTLYLYPNGRASIENGTASLCLQSLHPEEEQLSSFSAPNPPLEASQQHAAYVKTTPATTAEFLIVLDIGCKSVPTSLQPASGGHLLQIGTQTISLSQ